MKIYKLWGCKFGVFASPLLYILKFLQVVRAFAREERIGVWCGGGGVSLPWMLLK